MYFGGLWGTVANDYCDNKALESGKATFPADNQLSIPGTRCQTEWRICLQFAEEPKAVAILDENRQPLTAGDNESAYTLRDLEVQLFLDSTGAVHCSANY